MIYWPNDNYLAEMDSLQVVLTYDTDRHQRVRCFPWFMPKKYLNRYVLDGLHQTLKINPHRINEIYQWHRIIDLKPYQDCNPQQELELLFQWKQIDGTFHYLDWIAMEALSEYLYLNNNKLTHTVDTSRRDFQVQQELTSMLEWTLDTTFKVILPQQIKKATHEMLHNHNKY